MSKGKEPTEGLSLWKANTLNGICMGTGHRGAEAARGIFDHVQLLPKSKTQLFS